MSIPLYFPSESAPYTSEFPVVKLLDYEENWGLLAENNNLFPVIIMGYLKSQETRKNLLIIAELMSSLKLQFLF
ncbi:hypothetical protein [Okeania sp. SIO2B3]|uniref:hypothetical protein n=1 Tax=Okeania sp. SIO2B3 TaxID=2607784 RepID=UPI0013BF671E|nr:hypothetical protein [Okeania sp. SIO2B3]NET41475.1 hypothetical protein [Okeania sp. SIO2B3]